MEADTTKAVVSQSLEPSREADGKAEGCPAPKTYIHT